jgi:hypothetical protein
LFTYQIRFEFCEREELSETDTSKPIFCGIPKGEDLSRSNYLILERKKKDLLTFKGLGRNIFSVLKWHLSEELLLFQGEP